MSRPSPRVARPLALALILSLMAPRRALGHDFRPGVLALEETSPGRFEVAWTEPVDSLGGAAVTRVVFPSPCVSSGLTLSCGERGLHGAIEFEGLRARRMQVVVSVRWRDGATREGLVTGASPRFVLDEDPGRGGGVLARWLWLGLEHVARGADHVAFVCGLLLLVGLTRLRRVLATVTAFTLAHSLTLGLAALDLVRLPTPPVEATIAASVVLVARESLRETPTLSRRAPWVVALGFGLVHGLGFAGALASLGLPRGAVGRALVGFNLGVESGQLGVVLLALVASRALRALAQRRPSWDSGARRCAAYGLGALGAWWLVERVAAIVGR